MTVISEPKPKYFITKHVVYSFIGLCLLAIGVFPTVLGVLFDIRQSEFMIVVHLIVISGLAFILGLKNIKAALLVLMIFMPWQPFLTMPISESLGGTGVKVLVATKDVYATMLLIALFLKKGIYEKWTTPINLVAGLFLMVHILYALMSPASLLGVAVSFREGFMVIAFFLIGRLSGLSLDNLGWFLRICVLIAIVVATFGYIERFLFTEHTWEMIGVAEYMMAKKGWMSKRHEIEANVPRNWYATFFDKLYRRMVSGIGDPTSLSRYLTLPILSLLFIPLLFHKQIHLRLFLVFFFCGALFFTLGMGGWLIVLGGLMIWSGLNRSRLAIILLPLMAVVLIGVIALLIQYSSSAVPHLMSAGRGLQAIFSSPFGSGLGTAGTKALTFTDQALKGSGESYLAALAFQTSVAGVFTYSLFMYLVANSLFKLYYLGKKQEKENNFLAQYAALGLSLIIGIFMTSLFANSAVSPISAGPSLLFCGALVGLYSWRTKTTQIGSDTI